MTTRPGAFGEAIASDQREAGFSMTGQTCQASIT
jgi:hypothetical protein